MTRSNVLPHGIRPGALTQVLTQSTMMLTMGCLSQFPAPQQPIGHIHSNTPKEEIKLQEGPTKCCPLDSI